MATIDTSGDPILITYELPLAQAADFRQAVIDLFDMDPSTTNVQAANRVAQDLRERICRCRRRAAADAALAIDPGTVDFT